MMEWMELDRESVSGLSAVAPLGHVRGWRGCRLGEEEEA